jgi:D-alanyl-D-alanine carboxypeptidase/D-alanyl-D-alanine-endopeptidase (penicillin-binding protein 4)
MMFLMRASTAMPLLLALCWMAKAAELPGAPATIPELRASVSRLLTEPRFERSWWGIHVLSLDTGRTILSTNAGRLFVPASTAKLFTGALALDRLGPVFRIRTSLHAPTRPDDHGVLRSDLVVLGRGDPTFNARSLGGDWVSVFAPLAASLRRAGVTSIRGDLVADASHFRGSQIGSGWELDDLPWAYAAEVSALSVNDNAVEVMVRPAAKAGLPCEVLMFPSGSGLQIKNHSLTSTGSEETRADILPAPDRRGVLVHGRLATNAQPISELLSVPRPAAWFGRQFKAALDQEGIKVRGEVVEVTGEETGSRVVPPNWIELGFTESPPLRDLLARMLKPSQNLHAQLLLLQVGAAGASVAGTNETSEQAGLRAMCRFLAEADIASEEARMQEGTGLSRHDVVTPAALVKLLVFMAQHPHGQVFREALPLAGAEGTLRLRFRGTPAEHNLRAKTGSLDLVSSLAGYVRSAAGEELAFALMLNNHIAAPERPGRAELDTVAVWLSALRQHSRDLSAD